MIEIDCPDCKGKKIISRYNLDTDTYTNLPCPNLNCHIGKIKVYTEAEYREAIGEYANTKLYQEGYKSGVEKEREACALVCEEKYNKEAIGFYEKSMEMVITICAEAIRGRE